MDFSWNIVYTFISTFLRLDNNIVTMFLPQKFCSLFNPQKRLGVRQF